MMTSTSFAVLLVLLVQTLLTEGLCSRWVRRVPNIQFSMCFFLDSYPFLFAPRRPQLQVCVQVPVARHSRPDLVHETLVLRPAFTRALCRHR